jgi:hypothetical protein
MNDEWWVKSEEVWESIELSDEWWVKKSEDESSWMMSDKRWVMNDERRSVRINRIEWRMMSEEVWGWIELIDERWVKKCDNQSNWVMNDEWKVKKCENESNCVMNDEWWMKKCQDHANWVMSEEVLFILALLHSSFFILHSSLCNLQYSLSSEETKDWSSQIRNHSSFLKIIKFYSLPTSSLQKTWKTFKIINFYSLLTASL